LALAWRSTTFTHRRTELEPTSPAGGKPVAAGLWLAARIGWLINLPLPAAAIGSRVLVYFFAGLMAEQLWRARQGSNYPDGRGIACCNRQLLYCMAWPQPMTTCNIRPLYCGWWRP
jgi:uncharacterized protein involved in response to NO